MLYVQGGSQRNFVRVFESQFVLSQAQSSSAVEDCGYMCRNNTQEEEEPPETQRESRPFSFSIHSRILISIWMDVYAFK